MLIEFVYQSAHAIIPELNDSIVKRGKDPRALRVKCQSYIIIRKEKTDKLHSQKKKNQD